MPIRWVDEWDNANGTVERGYGGRSIFFDNGKVRDDLSAVGEYARLLASVGINGCNVNNVNGAAPFLDPDMIKGLARIADAMRPWGVRLAISVDIASPQKIGGLKTFDPLDPDVKAVVGRQGRLKSTRSFPIFAGFTVKADSEGQAGPASYGRSPADAANLLADALAPHGGVVLYRAFVYNNHLDYNDLKADRARAAYDIFHPLDGKFLPNVIVQIKEGPIDFQAQEPVSPLFAGLRKTNAAMELQITQEYLGQQRHLVYIAPMWKRCSTSICTPTIDRRPLKKSIIEGKSLQSARLGGMIGVAGVGRDGWLGSPLAMANLYAFGRLAWNPNLTPEQIAAEWTRQTISNDPQVVATVDKMLMQSWPAYVDYTGPLGTQTLTDITGSHYGPNIEASERNGWGQWHRDDAQGIGMDRTVATGTGFTASIRPKSRDYESLATTPDNLLLFFHHVPYTYKLHSGKTVIQYIYDSHYQGAAEARGSATSGPRSKAKSIRSSTTTSARASSTRPATPSSGATLSCNISSRRAASLTLRAAPATIPAAWRPKTRASPATRSSTSRRGKMPPAGKRCLLCLGQPFRRLAEPQQPDHSISVETCPALCTAQWTYSGPAGRFNIAVQYFDLQPGMAHFTLSVNSQQLVSWAADAPASRRPNGDNSTRFTSWPGDEESILSPATPFIWKALPTGATRQRSTTLKSSRRLERFTVM